MNRRSLLASGVAVGAAAVAGCLTGAMSDDVPDEMVLGSPDDGPGAVGDVSFPTYGEPFPTFELADPLAETTVDVDAIEDECVVATAFYATCPAECIPLIDSLVAVQGMVGERGLADRTRFLAITFDPERDDAEALRDHADMMHVNLEAGNWHYLRPETAAEAETIVADELGIPFDREETASGYEFAHVTVTFLVNPAGYVERSYQGDNPPQGQLADDVERILDDW